MRFSMAACLVARSRISTHAVTEQEGAIDRGVKTFERSDVINDEIERCPREDVEPVGGRHDVVGDVNEPVVDQGVLAQGECPGVGRNRR